MTFHTYKNWGKINGFERKQGFTTTIDLNQSTEGIWGKINRQHKRHIRRAENNGTKVTVSNKFEEFYRFNEMFLKRKNYLGIPYLDIFSSQFMQKYGILFIAENQGELIGGNFFIHDENDALSVHTAYQLFENSIEKKPIFDANCYIHWEAIQYFKNLNVINYDLGGTNYFKRSFGGDVIPKFQYRKFNSRFWKQLYYSWNLYKNVDDFSTD